MRDRVLVDADVAIDYLRDRPEAVAFLEGERRPILLSVLTVAELYGGVCEHERPAMDRFVEGFDVVLLEADDAVRGGLFRRDFGRSHGTGRVDACLAAQAERLGAEVATLNAKHFPMLTADALRVPYPKP